MDTDKGRWNVMQRNKKDNPISFDKSWAQYDEGFSEIGPGRNNIV